ncbi:MAG: hypothetical protein ACKOBZ_05115 [Nitrospira sp.]
MAKKKKMSLAEDETRLKTKVSEKRTALKNPEGDEKFRKLHKRLKRLQRLRRKFVERKKNAMGKAKSEATADKPAAPAA